MLKETYISIDFKWPRTTAFVGKKVPAGASVVQTKLDRCSNHHWSFAVGEVGVENRQALFLWPS